ncbi:MAG: MarR family winged helix-turn-helix transcriptional regulator [Streptosporangiaceae bacterium]
MEPADPHDQDRAQAPAGVPEPADRPDQDRAQAPAAVPGPADRPDQGTAQVPAAEPEFEPQWLTEEERDAWIPLVGVLIKLPAALDAQLQRDAGLSHFEYMVLSRLSEAPRHSLRMSDLAILANGSLSRLSHVVTRLERRGWVRRESCPGDGRYTNAVLTDDGWAKVVATAPGHVTAVRQLVVDALSPEQVGQLRDIAEQVMGRVVPGADWLGQLPHPARRLAMSRPAADLRNGRLNRNFGPGWSSAVRLGRNPEGTRTNGSTQSGR